MGNDGSQAKWRNLEAKWRKSCCDIIQKQFNIEIFPYSMIQIAFLFYSTN